MDVRDLPQPVPPHDIDLTAPPADSAVTFDEGARLGLAKSVLIGLFIFSFFVVIMHGWQPDNKAWADVFEWVKVGALPLVTLVIGFYFPSTSKK